jgi:HK97 family phage portal protein
VAFVQSAGSVQSLSRPSYTVPQRIMLSSTFSADYLQIYRTQDAVRMVIGFLARNIAQLGLHTYRRKGDTDRERLIDHPLARLLSQPNPWTTKYRFLETLVIDKAIYDVAYLLKMGTPQAPSLVRLPPRMVEPKGDNWLTPDEFEFAGTKGKLRVPADRVVYFRGYGGDSDGGMSPLESLRRTLREEWTGSEMREQIMRNGARASGYIKRPPKVEAGEWSKEAKDRFRQQWQSQYSGDNGAAAGGTPILEDGMEFQAVSQTAKELQYVEGRKLTREEVAQAYFVQPPMVGILDHATFSNITELHKMLYQDTLGPWLTMIQDEIALQVIPDFPDGEDMYAEFNLREKLSGSFEERSDSIQKAVGAPWMTVNEARALENRPPVEGGDELVRPLNVTQNGDQDPVPAEEPAIEDEQEG